MFDLLESKFLMLERPISPAWPLLPRSSCPSHLSQEPSELCREIHVAHDGAANASADREEHYLWTLTLFASYTLLSRTPGLWHASCQQQHQSKPEAGALLTCAAMIRASARSAVLASFSSVTRDCSHCISSQSCL